MMPTDDYILRSDINDATRKWFEKDDDHRSFAEVIKDIPAADVEPVRHGRWIDKSDDEYAYCENVYQCSVCGEEWDILEGTPKQNSYHYCPNCGAKMDDELPKGEDDDEKNL